MVVTRTPATLLLLHDVRVRIDPGNMKWRGAVPDSYSRTKAVVFLAESKAMQELSDAGIERCVN